MPHALGSLGVSIAAGAMFLWLSSQVMTSESIAAIDAAAFEVAVSIHTPRLTTLVTWITTIGNTSEKLLPTGATLASCSANALT